VLITISLISLTLAVRPDLARLDHDSNCRYRDLLRATSTHSVKGAMPVAENRPGISTRGEDPHICLQATHLPHILKADPFHDLSRAVNNIADLSCPEHLGSGLSYVFIDS
jgi:hypothetical protein